MNIQAEKQFALIISVIGVNNIVEALYTDKYVIQGEAVLWLHRGLIIRYTTACKGISDQLLYEEKGTRLLCYT